MSASLLHALESAFTWILEASWQASVLAALVLLLQWAFCGKLNPRWHHALWLLVIARLVLPVLPESALSLFQFAPSTPRVVEQTMTTPIFAAPLVLPAVAAVTTPAPTAPQYSISAFTVLALIWLVGAIGLLLLTWCVNRRFASHVSSALAITDPHLMQLAEAARRGLRIRRSVRIIESSQVQSPAIMGLFRPTLILPTDVRSRFSDGELRFILLHEFAHLKRGDLFLQWLVALLQILHWFNPVLWFAFRRIRIDREPATDALVLSSTGEEQKETYGRVLVKLLQHYHSRHAIPTLVGILEDKDQFKRRFTLITNFTRSAYGWSLLGVAMLALLAAICLTKAKAQDDATKAQKYFELIFVAEKPGTNDGLGASGPVWVEDFAKLLKNPNCKITVLADAPVQDGPISLRARTPAGFDVTVTGNWNTSIRAPQKIGYHFHQQPHPTAIGTVAEQSWESSDVLSEGNPLLLLLLTRVDDHDRVLIHIVDHSTAVTSATNSGIQSSNASTDAEAGRTGDTLAQLVLALTDKAKTIPHDHQRLQILQGFYGADGSWRDVTSILQKSVKNNSLKVSWQQPYTEIGGDPAYLQVKTLIVSYRLDGIEKLATFREENPPVGLQATLPIQSAGSPAAPSPPLNKASITSTTAPGADHKDIAAIVDGHVITLDDLREQWVPARKDLEDHYSGKELQELLEEMGRKIPMALIDRQLILEDFKGQGGFIPKSYTDQIIDGIVRDQYRGDRTAFLRTLAQRGVTMDQYREEIENNAIVGYMRNKLVGQKVRDFWRSHPELFPADDRFNVTVLQINGSKAVPPNQTGNFAAETDPQAQVARRALMALKTGGDLSAFVSDGEDRGAIGVPVWVARHGLPQAQADMPAYWPFSWNWDTVSKLKPGETTDIIVSDYSYAWHDGPSQNRHCYWMLRLNEHRPATAPATPEIENREKRLIATKTMGYEEAWLAPLRAKAKVQIFDAALTVDPWAITKPPAPPTHQPNAVDGPDAPASSSNT